LRKENGAHVGRNQDDSHDDYLRQSIFSSQCSGSIKNPLHHGRIDRVVILTIHASINLFEIAGTSFNIAGQCGKRVMAHQGEVAVPDKAEVVVRQQRNGQDQQEPDYKGVFKNVTRLAVTVFF